MKKTIVSVDTLNFSLKGENIVIGEKNTFANTSYSPQLQKYVCTLIASSKFTEITFTTF